MAENKYLIKNPVLVDDWEGTGLRAATLYGFNADSVDYGLVPSSAPENIWCIGFIANVPTSGNPLVADGTPNAQPIVLSNVKGDVTVYCDHHTSYDSGYSDINELVYGGKTYYYSGKNLYPMGFDSSAIINNIIPIYTGETFPDHETAALKLIELYKAEGGLMPGEGYPTSWVRKLVGNAWQKTFAFAHAKTVYTDFANKTTLADKLSAVDVEIAQQSTEMMDIKMLGWSVPRECPIQNEIDGNQFIQKVGRIDLGSLEWLWDKTSGHERLRTASNALSFVKPASSNSAKGNIWTFKYINTSAENTYAHTIDKSISVDVVSILFVYDSSYTDYTDTAAFKQAMQGQYFYYELATPIITTIDGNEIGETVSNVRKKTTVNLLKPTLQTTTSDGVTCTNNGDGTYTLNGTANKEGFFKACDINLKLKTYRLLGCPVGGKNETYMLSIQLNGDTFDTFIDYGNGKSFTVSKVSSSYSVMFYFKNGTVFNNLVFKPMLTSNLSATYDDFVPYTGDTGSLNGDVASLLKRIKTLESIVNKADTTVTE